MKRIVALLALIFACGANAAIRRSPPDANVNAQGATTVFLTYSGLVNQVAADAFWCGELIDASPDVGQQCRPDTLYGRLPPRYDQSQTTGALFTDVMTIPPNVARRAYDAAASGERSSFYYVRRFVSTSGGRDEYVVVTLRMGAAGANTPLSLTNVHLAFDARTPLLRVRPGTTPPRFSADLHYTGTGRITGRWEIVLPTDEPPTADDLVPSTRTAQRRYTQLERFSVFLPPTGRFQLMGPNPSKLPTATEGSYQVLLRIESGAVAGFALPTLRYYVGTGTSAHASDITLIDASGSPLTFRWDERGGTAFHRLEVRDASGALVLEATLDGATHMYIAPPWFNATGALKWRVVGIDGEGEIVSLSAWKNYITRG